MIRKALSLAALGAAIVAIAPASATAEPTGALTIAESNSVWTRAHIAGSISENGQFAGYGPDYPASLVQWIPVVTVAPSLPAYGCQGDEFFDSDPNTRVVYSGGAQPGPGTVAFDVPDAFILSGVYGQRACLSEVVTVSAQQAVCIVQAPILGQDPHACPFVNILTTRSVAGKTITPAPTPTPTPSPTPTPTPTPLPTAPAPAKARFTGSKRTIQASRSGRFSFSFKATPRLKGQITLKTVREVPSRKLGNKAFTVPSSGKATVKFKLSRRQRVLLERYKKHRIAVTVKLRNSADLTSTATVGITLRAPSPARGN